MQNATAPVWQCARNHPETCRGAQFWKHFIIVGNRWSRGKGHTHCRYGSSKLMVRKLKEEALTEILKMEDTRGVAEQLWS